MNKKLLQLYIITLLVPIVFLSSCKKEAENKTDYNVSQAGNTVPTPASSAKTTAEIGSGNVTAIIPDGISPDDIIGSDDSYSGWENENPVYIELTDTSADFKGTGVIVNNSTITITESGVYVFSGKLNNGQIIVDSPGKGIVRLVLNGMSVTCPDSAPLYVKSADKTVISLQDGTRNYITDGETYIFPDSETDEPNAAIFSKDDLTINGTGTLTVKANFNNGITSKDDLVITGGSLFIDAADDGLMGRDLVAVTGGNITIVSGGDGIKSTNDTDAEKGFIVIGGGKFDITADADGIQAKSSLYINGGEFTLSTGGSSTNSSFINSGSRQNTWGKWGNTTKPGIADEELQSAKGLKASTGIIIHGGTFEIDSSDDAIHSNDTISLADGIFNIFSGDDGIHADKSISITGGEINIKKCYEGIESAMISISGGNIRINANDDGINIAGGNDGSAVNGRPGQNTFRSTGNNRLEINGGYITVNAAGDGLDANGSIYMSGGAILVNGPTSSGNGALDYDGAFEISGGFLIAAGSAGMAQAPSVSSKQNSIHMVYSQVQQADTLIHLQDSQGNTVVTFEPEKNYQSIVISSPELKTGTTYTLYTGGKSTGELSDGLYTGGIYQNGTKAAEMTLSGSVTVIRGSGASVDPRTAPGGGNLMNPGRLRQ